MSYGKLNQRKISEKDYVLSCERAREELSDYINEEAKRVNIDSAKKRAVLQRMDYEGFRQMVLGANIFPTKTNQLKMFTKGEQPNKLDLIEVGEEKQMQQKSKNREISAVESAVQTKSQKHCISFREFKKKFMQSYSQEANLEKTLECYNLIKEQNQERLSKIFNAQCEANILLKVTEIFARVIKEMNNNQTQGIQNECGFILLFYKYIMEIPTMKTLSLMILSKKQKQSIADFITSLQQLLPESREQIEQISMMIMKK